MTFLTILIAVIIAPIVVLTMIIKAIIKKSKENHHKKVETEYKQLESAVLSASGLRYWDAIPHFDEYVPVKSRQALENYDVIKFFKENSEKLVGAEMVLIEKDIMAKHLSNFLEDNEYKNHPQYLRVESRLKTVLEDARAYRIAVHYVSPAGNHLAKKEIEVDQRVLDGFKNDPSLLMGKGEYNKFLKEQQKEALEQKHYEYYERVNNIIDYANKNRDLLVIKGSQEQLDKLVKTLESKLTAKAFAKEQRLLMTRKLREFIKTRDNFTCCDCGNSTHAEPNLLLEIDHIIPVSKGGCTEETNLQTLCWKCNRTKSDKIFS